MRLQDKEHPKHYMKWNIYKRLQGKIDSVRKIRALITVNELYMKGMDFKEMMETTMLEDCNNVSGFCHTHSSLSRKLMTSMAGNCYFKIIIFEVLLIISNKVILLGTQANKLLHSLFWCVDCSLSSRTCNTAKEQHPQSAMLNESSHKLVPID